MESQQAKFSEQPYQKPMGQQDIGGAEGQPIRRRFQNEPPGASNPGKYGNMREKQAQRGGGEFEERYQPRQSYDNRRGGGMGGYRGGGYQGRRGGSSNFARQGRFGGYNIQDTLNKMDFSQYTRDTTPTQSDAQTHVTKEQLKAFLDEHEIKLECHKKLPIKDPQIFFSFDDMHLNKQTKQAIKTAGFEAPTHIQSVCWPILTEGKNLIAIAQTGSGKTLAFILPAINKIIDNPDWRRTPNPQVLIIAPTRELAVQIQQECFLFGRPSMIRSLVVYGGASRFPQQQKLADGCEILICTPGRLNDFLDSGQASLQDIKFVVMDEADRLLDMGFEPQIRAILDHIPKGQTQNVLLSATWPNGVRDLARDFCHNAIKVSIKTENSLSNNKNIKQTVEALPFQNKTSRMVYLLKNQINNDKTLIFCKTQYGCEKVSQDLMRHDIENECTHGGKSQSQREIAIKKLKSGQINVLVATDVASRGLDIKDIKYVLNYDYPMSIEDYVHRIGRTGRAGELGEAITFFTEENKFQVNEIYDFLKDTNQIIPEPIDNISRIMNDHRKYRNKKHLQRSDFIREFNRGQQFLLREDDKYKEYMESAPKQFNKSMIEDGGEYADEEAMGDENDGGPVQERGDGRGQYRSQNYSQGYRGGGGGYNQGYRGDNSREGSGGYRGQRPRSGGSSGQYRRPSY